MAFLPYKYAKILIDFPLNWGQNSLYQNTATPHHGDKKGEFRAYLSKKMSILAE